MTVLGVVVAALLVLGCAAVLLSCIAVLRLPGLPSQLHGLAPAGTIGAPLLCLAVALEEGVGRSAGKALMVAVVLVVTGPVTATVTARSGAQARRPVPGLEPPEGSNLRSFSAPTDAPGQRP